MRVLAICVTLGLVGCGGGGGSDHAALAPNGSGAGGNATGAGGSQAAGTSGQGGSDATALGGAMPIPTNLVIPDVSCKAGTPKDLPVGTWTALGPPGVETSAYGMVGITIDPSNHDVLYTAIQDNGIWKSCDRGSTWFRLGAPNMDPDVWDDTSNYLDVPFEIAVDPKDSMHLYATDGVRGGSDLGFWVSTNGGAVWLKTPGFKAIAKATTIDETDIAVDPVDFAHVLVASHSPWSGLNNAGVIETTDGGMTWVQHNPVMSWPEGTNGIEFLFDPSKPTQAGVNDNKMWLNLTQDGVWRTLDGGGHWDSVGPFPGIHGLNVAFRAKSGVMYAGATGSPIRSADNGKTWTQDTMGLPYGYYYVVWGDGQNLYTARSLNFGAMPGVSFFTSPDGDGTNWTQMGTETFSDGPITMKYDDTNHIVYAACWKAGLIALKTQ